MDLGVFTVDTWGARVGAGATDPQYCTLNGVAKVAPAGVRPYLVANEQICARLASIINLPVPPGVIVESTSGQVGYVALRFGNANERPPRLIPTDLVNDCPEIAAGILTFDCWVANGDRHAENLAYSPNIWPQWRSTTATHFSAILEALADWRTMGSWPLPGSWRST